jgi:hypothetical protein
LLTTLEVWLNILCNFSNYYTWLLTNNSKEYGINMPLWLHDHWSGYIYVYVCVCVCVLGQIYCLQGDQQAST